MVKGWATSCQRAIFHSPAAAVDKTLWRRVSEYKVFQRWCQEECDGLTWWCVSVQRGLLNYQWLPCYIFSVLLKLSTRRGRRELSRLELQIQKKCKNCSSVCMWFNHTWSFQSVVTGGHGPVEHHVDSKFHNSHFIWLTWDCIYIKCSGPMFCKP